MSMDKTTINLNQACKPRLTVTLAAQAAPYQATLATYGFPAATLTAALGTLDAFSAEDQAHTAAVSQATQAIANRDAVVQPQRVGQAIQQNRGCHAQGSARTSQETRPLTCLCPWQQKPVYSQKTGFCVVIQLWYTTLIHLAARDSTDEQAASH